MTPNERFGAVVALLCKAMRTRHELCMLLQLRSEVVGDVLNVLLEEGLIEPDSSRDGAGRLPLYRWTGGVE